MSVVDQTNFIYDHLNGEAKNEIRYRSRHIRENPKSFIASKEQFYARKQQEGESLREFSHALFSLMDRIVESGPDEGVPDATELLTAQFIENVYDG